jgi:hydrogenase maturation protease
VITLNGRERQTSLLSTVSWQATLAQALGRVRPPDQPPRLAIVGLGHSLGRDYGAGLAVARALVLRQDAARSLLVIDAEFAPENHLGPVRRFRPDLALLVGATDMGEAAGTVRWLSWSKAQQFEAPGQAVQPSALARYLVESLGCEVALLGIQPSTGSAGAQFSAEVRQAVAEVVQALVEAAQTS